MGLKSKVVASMTRGKDGFGFVPSLLAKLIVLLTCDSYWI